MLPDIETGYFELVRLEIHVRHGGCCEGDGWWEEGSLGIMEWEGKENDRWWMNER